LQRWKDCTRDSSGVLSRRTAGPSHIRRPHRRSQMRHRSQSRLRSRRRHRFPRHPDCRLQRPRRCRRSRAPRTRNRERRIDNGDSVPACAELQHALCQQKSIFYREICVCHSEPLPRTRPRKLLRIMNSEKGPTNVPAEGGFGACFSSSWRACWRSSSMNARAVSQLTRCRSTPHVRGRRTSIRVAARRAPRRRYNRRPKTALVATAGAVLYLSVLGMTAEGGGVTPPSGLKVNWSGAPLAVVGDPDAKIPSVDAVRFTGARPS